MRESRRVREKERGRAREKKEGERESEEALDIEETCRIKWKEKG